MERLLVLRLAAQGCCAEACLNGVPVARVDATRTSVVLPVHEYTVAGSNELELVVEPGVPGAPPAPALRLGDGRSAAVVQLLLPRAGQPAHPASARNLAQIEWVAEADQVFEFPLRRQQSIDLPIGFPRWRFLDAPPIPDAQALAGVAAQYLVPIAVGLARGDPEPLVTAARLRFEDLASAYQRNLAEEVGRFRVHVQKLHAAQPLKPPLPTASSLRLRPVAGGRLLECLRADGEPLLQSPRPDGGAVAFPMRLAAIDGRFYVLR